MTALPLAVLLLLGAAPPAAGAAARTERAIQLTLPDDELLDQDGRPVRLPALLGERVVAMNFVFSTCSTICSPMSAVFGRLQRELGEAVGRDVQLVSITLDPARDTPARLKRFSALFGQKPGWSFLTGEPARVTRVLKALGGWVPDKTSHTPVTLVGNPATGRWVRVYGMPTTARLREALVEVGLGTSPGAAATGAPAAAAAPPRQPLRKAPESPVQKTTNPAEVR